MFARMVGDLRDVFELNVGEFLVEQISTRTLRGLTAFYGADSITVESNCRDSQTEPF